MKWHEDQNEIYANRKKLIGEIFDYLNLSYDPNSVGMFVWGKVPDELENVEQLVDDILYKTDVFITPGFIFGSNGSRYIRAVSYTHLRAHETLMNLVCRLLLEKKGTMRRPRPTLLRHPTADTHWPMFFNDTATTEIYT